MTSADGGKRSVQTLCRNVAASLMKDQACDIAFGVRDKGNLCVDDLREELRLRFCVDVQRPLPCGLSHKMVPCPSHGENEVRRKLVLAAVFVEHTRR